MLVKIIKQAQRRTTIWDLTLEGSVKRPKASKVQDWVTIHLGISLPRKMFYPTIWCSIWRVVMRLSKTLFKMTWLTSLRLIHPRILLSLLVKTTTAIKWWADLALTLVHWMLSRQDSSSNSFQQGIRIRWAQGVLTQFLLTTLNRCRMQMLIDL